MNIQTAADLVRPWCSTDPERPNLHRADYAEMLESKTKTARFQSIPNPHVPAMAFDYQRRIIEWACRIGRACIFADCGLGKTMMQLAWAQSAAAATGLPTLIIAPLSVTSQTVAESVKFGMACEYVRRPADMTGTTQIVITNYDRIDDFTGSAELFGALVLDESSIIKSHDGKTRTALLEYAQEFEFRLACTATPAPNDYIEIGNHAEFVGVCSRQEMLAEWFIHDTSGATDSWRIKGHAVSLFWEWVARWAVAIRRPSDIGGDDSCHVLPPMTIEKHLIMVSHNAEGELFRSQATALSDVRKEMRHTMADRVARVASIVANAPGEQWLVWVHTNDESQACTRAIPDAFELTGSMTPEEKADAVVKFARGDIRVMVTKPSIAGFGVNWQQCANTVWCSVSYSYEQFYQAVRRFWRFGQSRPVSVHVVIADTQQAMWSAVESKSNSGDEMMQNMVEATHRIGLDMDRVHGARDRGYTRDVAKGRDYELHLGDCVDVFRDAPDDSIGLSVFSPPFASLYTYSDSERDMGNCADDTEFMQHFGFLIPELLRATIPGRLCAVHCMQLTTSKMRDGEIGLKDFRGMIIAAFIAAGWVYHSEVTIWKDPVTAMQRTKAHGLLHKTLCSDSTRSRQGIADYLVIFRKPGINPTPVREGDDARFSSYVGTEPPAGSPEYDARRYSIDVWQRYASPVWFDIDQGRTLQYTTAREDKDEKHICPLQLDVIERAIHMWSNPGDLIASPFSGIGSELVTALKMGRRAFGAELKRSYWNIAKANLHDVENPNQSSLF
jgi:superfamily II DNA or RNA helicase